MNEAGNRRQSQRQCEGGIVRQWAVVRERHCKVNPPVGTTVRRRRRMPARRVGDRALHTRTFAPNSATAPTLQTLEHGSPKQHTDAHEGISYLRRWHELWGRTASTNGPALPMAPHTLAPTLLSAPSNKRQQRRHMLERDIAHARAAHSQTLTLRSTPSSLTTLETKHTNVDDASSSSPLLHTSTRAHDCPVPWNTTAVTS